MSRALGKEAKEILRNGDHRGVFEDISGVLCRPCDQLYEIEILGHGALLDPTLNYAQVGNALAVPKLRLVQAFIFARQLLLDHIRGGLDDTDKLWRATAVILLMDPEFLTAANIRKRLLREMIQEKTATQELLRERHFIDSLLTSHLHRHTKSPTLWNHRRWLMDQFRIHRLGIDVGDDIQNIISIAGERHPRNYYAWCHARYLVNTITFTSQNCEEELSTLITMVRKWSFSHHDDISGWQFLLFLLNRQPSEASSSIRQTIERVEMFKWRNEAIWYFIRYAVALPCVEDQDRDEVSRVRNLLWEAAAEDSQERRILEAAQKWISA
ncbi:hypothetical protein BGZ63DRAFT_365318 [Mariannaea sp. PMI_226]|nr:hypothetical protein BGZ63DRAFT_365318 [Mariannaea sp. PMI_226]